MVRLSVCCFVARLVVPCVVKDLVPSVQGSSRHCGPSRYWEALAVHQNPGDLNPLKHHTENVKSLYGPFSDSAYAIEILESVAVHMQMKYFIA